MALPAGRYGVTKSMLLKIKKLPMNTIKMLEELKEKIETGLTSQTQLLEDTVGWTGKNIAKSYNYNGSNNGVTFTYEGNKVTVNGTPSANASAPNSSIAQSLGLYFSLAKGTYTVSLVGDNVSADRIEPQVIASGGTLISNGTFTLAQDTDVFVRVRALLNASFNNEVFYIMLNKGETAEPYVPYHAPVEESKTDNSVISGNIENGTTASKSYVVGEHFMRSGKFATATTPIASGDTLTEGTNYTVGDVGSELTTQSADVTLTTTGTNRGITLNNSFKTLYRYGKVVDGHLRITLANDITPNTDLGVILMPWKPKSTNPRFIVTKSDTLEMVDVVMFINSNSLHLTFKGNNILLSAGSYDINISYICE